MMDLPTILFSIMLAGYCNFLLYSLGIFDKQQFKSALYNILKHIYVHILLHIIKYGFNGIYMNIFTLAYY